jgi:3-methyladenine DNA glycosylase AlkC
MLSFGRGVCKLWPGQIEEKTVVENENGIEQKTQGVPKDTPERNCLDAVSNNLAGVIGKDKASAFIKAVVDAGYFDLALLDQGRLLMRKVAEIPDAEKVVDALLRSEVDRLRALAITVQFELYGSKLEVMVRFLYRSGAKAGTWTQETSQSVLKDVIHKHGLEKVLSKVYRWATNNDPAIRRMLIEAIRPRGVWCKHIDELKRDPSILKEILEQVLDDPSEYVRKAAANNINDISKDNPTIVCQWVKEWSKGAITPEREWVIQRGLRTLVKNADPTALALMNFGGADKLDVDWKRGTPETVSIGETIPFTVVITNRNSKTIKVRLQVTMIGPGKGDKRRISKYLLGTVTIAKGESKELVKSVKFAHKNSVRKVAGNYELLLSCNGRDIDKRSFDYEGEGL